MSEFQVVPIERLRESPTNPRRHVDKAAFDELVKSVTTHGVLVPLLVRPLADAELSFEIVAGSRRYKAAKKAGIAEIPIRARPLTDVEVLEIQVIENIQRADVHPLDEGEGYRVLMQRAGYEVPAIAEKVGKSVSYVYQRLKLTELTPAAKKAFLADAITAGHAILLARLQPKDQAEALKECALDDDAWDGPASVRDLARWIDHQIHLDLNSAPFPKADAQLVPAAGPCTTCPKRTGFAPELFPDIKKKDTCTDRVCFHGKVEAFLAQQRTALAAKGGEVAEVSQEYGRRTKGDVIPAGAWIEAKGKACEATKTGLIVNGRERGKVLKVCTDPGCKKHREVIHDYATSPRTIAAQKAQRDKARVEEQARQWMLDAILAKVPASLQRAELHVVAQAMYGRLWHEHQRVICKRRGWEIKKLGKWGGRDMEGTARPNLAVMPPAELGRFLMEVALVRELAHSPHDRTPAARLVNVAKHYKISPEKLRAAARREDPKRIRAAKPTGKKA
jgi:ParB family chromosome partitioning protein